MINVSKAFRKALADDRRNFQKSAVITLLDGTILNITNANIWANGFNHEDAVSSDNELDIGSAIVNAFNLTLNNIYEDYSAYDFQGAEVVPKISLLIDGLPEEVPMGTYTVDEAKYNGSIISLSCMDNMIFFDKPYSESQLVYPATLNTIVRNACTICGVPLGTLTFPHDDYIVQTRPDDEAITFRDVISYCAQIAGCFARVSTEGVLEIKWFDQTALEALYENLDGGVFDSSTPYSSGDTADGGLFNPWNTGYVYDAGSLTEYEDIHFIVGLFNQEISTDYVVITGVHVIVPDADGNDVTYTSGTDGYVIEISRNPLITQSTAQTVANWLGQQLIGLKYKKANVSHLSDPTMEAGDIAVVWDYKSHGSPILVTRTVFKASGTQQTVSAAETPTKNSTERYSQQTKNFVELRKRVKQQLGTFEQKQEELEERMDNAGGLYKTEVAQPDGSTIIYYHDKPDLEESEIQFVISDVGIMITPDGGDTWYGLAVDGQMIASILTAIGVNADWINTGQLSVTKNGQEVLFVDVDTGTVRIVADSFSLSSGKTIPDIADDAVKGIEIGGRNILNDSASMKSWHTRNAASVLNGVATLIGSSSNYDGTIDTAKYDASLYDGSEYIVSFDYNVNIDCTVVSNICASSNAISDTTWTRTRFTKWVTDLTLPNTNGEWKRFAFPSKVIDIDDFDEGSGNVVSGFLQFHARTSGATLQLRHMKFERGNKATDWTVSQADQTADMVALLDAFDTSLDQAEVFKRLTNNLANQGIYLQNGQLYLNASMIATGSLLADFITAGTMSANRINGGTLALGGLNNKDGVLEVYDANSVKRVDLTKDGMGMYPTTDYEILYPVNEKYSASQTASLHRDRVGRPIFLMARPTGMSDYDKRNHYNTFVFADNRLDFNDYYEEDPTNKAGLSLYPDSISLMTRYSPSSPSTALGSTYLFTNSANQQLTHGATYIGSESGSFIGRLSAATVWGTPDLSLFLCGMAFGGAFVYDQDQITVKGKIYSYGSASFNGNLAVYGTKNRIIDTDNYRDRLLYCYEMPSPMFGDIGEGVTDEDGICIIDLDDIFSETIAANIEYQVFLQKEGRGDIWVAEKHQNYFMVEGTPNLKFAWEIKAKQKDYEYERLEHLPDSEYEPNDLEHIYDTELSEILSQQEGALYA